MIAWRYLRPRKKEAAVSIVTIISLVGVTLGVAALIIVMAVMNGFRAELLDRILGLNGHVIVQPIERPLDDYDAVAARITAVDGVTLAVPLIEGQTLASGNVGAGTGALVRGVRAEDFSRLESISGNLTEGSLVPFAAGEGVVIGIRMARNLGLIAGDRITLVSPDGDVTPFGTTPRVKSYPVAAIFEMGMSEYDGSIIFMPFEEAQLYFNSEGVAQLIEIFIDDPDAVDAYRPLIEEAGDRPMFLVDWRQRNSAFFSALVIERNAMFLILSIVVLVASLNIISSLIMLVKEKGRGIAILRTMGASQSSILRIFIMAGTGVGVVGTAAGVLLGVIVCWNIQGIQRFMNWVSGAEVWDPTIRFLSEIPARMNPGETLAVVLLSLALSFLAAIIPARRAAKLDPVEALRYE
ncbi:MAG: lipoprotein-releasing ABC transporter permease subunit [Roseitalea sp.]|uniref:lipoprotein-releasing ABC transporter permease subunit n=1 Tax=Oceaniradius stylonematis TaxID=2184161 RepID=UPI001B0648C2|nr:lipoprotein-releasing ABC transporter permease subunit [Oceaniradius stylonematis]MBO6553062.1 lipoprotein-releasing ABC transporter permease subunit [Roseitalea sp.]MBO6951178.1 lipoprotein-releasing ABC transporter permease subunit [Rhizobiaceae bacterium]MBO6590835.1 lipoprotein-releasing ABC transporter permease subunit [Roseitalea sp.]MBO6599907.1 lipoprotein-releasing ABC transporter permease subunit [Roseitalea sp.]MBO6611663.1 lipoprotein-releasing ABC transporter permease subunit [